MAPGGFPQRQVIEVMQRLHRQQVVMGRVDGIVEIVEELRRGFVGLEVVPAFSIGLPLPS